MFDLVYNFTSRTSFDLELQHWNKEYDVSTSDYSSNQAKLIFKREFGIFNISAGAGYQNRSFDDNSLDDIDVITYNLNFDGEGMLANRKSYISLNVDQNFNDQSFGDNYFTATRFILSGGHEFSSEMSVDAEVSYQIADYERTTRKDEAYELSCSISYMFTSWLAFSVTAGNEKRYSNLDGFDYDNTYFVSKLEFAYD